MDDDDFVAIEERLQNFAVVLGAPEIAEDRFYRVRPAPELPERLMEPRERVLAQLDALDRFLSVYDRAVYDATMEKIRGILSHVPAGGDLTGNIPEHAVVLFPGRAGDAEEVFDLRGMPNLTEARARLRELAARLREE